MNLSDFLSDGRFLVDLQSADKIGVLRELSEFAFEKGLVDDPDAMFQGLVNREELISTGIGGGVAIPHTRCKGSSRLFLVFGRSKSGVDFDALDGESAHLFVTIVGPEDESSNQLKVLSRTARLLKQNEFREEILKAKTEDEVLRYIRQEEDRW